MELTINQLFKCDICDAVIEIVNVGEHAPSLVCCNQKMKYLEPIEKLENIKDCLPVLTEGVYDTSIVTVGADHSHLEHDCDIKWIEIINNSYVNRKYIAPNEIAEAHFFLPVKEGVYVRAYCTKHGLLQTKY